MRRKIEAKMKARGISTQDARQIANDVVAENGDSQVNTPSQIDTPPIPSPESPKESPFAINSPVLRPMDSATSIVTHIDSIPMDVTPDDDEARLLAEIEQQRLAEERARQRLHELENRLAKARLDKTKRSQNVKHERQITQDTHETKCAQGIQSRDKNDI
jgi:hypothetical protein